MTTTKAQRKTEQLQRHYTAISALLQLCGVNYENENFMFRKAKNTSSRLLQIERISNKAATDYCNGDIDTDTWERISDIQQGNVQLLFNGNLKGLFINGDARGYSLKISDKVMRELYAEIRLQTDWGGYGLLAPEIDGN